MDGRSLSEGIVQLLEQEILTGKLRAGEKLAEQVLSERFKVSRGSLREAIRTLEGRRLLERVPFVGVRVIDLSDSDLEQILVTREALEGMASRYAAENMTLREVRRLRECAENMQTRIGEEGLGAVFRDGTQDNDFHLQIVRGSRNRWLSEILCRDLYSLLRICSFRTASVDERPKTAAEEHLTIVEAIERRDPDEAERLMRIHITNARDNLLRIARHSEVQS